MIEKNLKETPGGPIGSGSGPEAAGIDRFLGRDAPLAEPAELNGWILAEDADLLAVNKPGWLVCHPSKRGPFSSLVGAFREHTGLETLHLVSRLDRETSGVVLLAKHRAAARRLQMALQERRVEKVYLALLEGQMAEPADVDVHLAKDLESAVHVKQAVRRSNSSKPSRSTFRPLAAGGGYTLAEVKPLTGRKHQIRVHAAWLGHPVAGDKLYGADESLYLEFIEEGWTERLAAALPLPRHALHATRLVFRGGPDENSSTSGERDFHAPLAPDLAAFCNQVGIAVPGEFLPADP